MKIKDLKEEFAYSYKTREMYKKRVLALSNRIGTLWNELYKKGYIATISKNGNIEFIRKKKKK